MIPIRYSGLTLALAILSAAPACPPPVRLTYANFSPSALTFAPQVASSTATASAPQTVTLTASGQAALIISSIDASGDFSQTNNCTSPLADGASCEIQVSFTPNSIGTVLGAVTLSSNAVGAPHIVNLAGTGLPPVSFSPDKLDFGSVAVNVTSPAKTLTLTNNQAAGLAISSIGATGNYSQTNSCPATLLAGQSCQISVQFQPTSSATIPGALNVTTDASPGTQPVALTGVGTGSGSSNVAFSASRLVFGNQEADSTSPPKSVTLTNQGSTSLTIHSVGVSAGYASTDNCAGKMLSPGSTCSIGVTFAPDADFAPVDYPAAITVVDSDSSSPQVVGLSGTGVAPITSSPSILDFGQVLVDSTSPSKTVTLTNNDAATEGLTLAESGGFDASTATTCPSSLGAGETCTVDVALTTNTYLSHVTGPVNGAITITSTSGGFLTPEVVSLKACATELMVSPPSFNFGAVAVGSSSPPETMTLSSVSGTTINISGVAVAGANPGDFMIANNACQASVSGSCTLDVTYVPQASGLRSGTISVTDDDGCSPHQQKVSGGSSAGPFTLYVSAGGGSAAGTVISSPPGINCSTGGGGTCSGSFASGTSVTLTGDDQGSHISGWSGACTGAGQCVIKMDGDSQVTAAFAPDPQLIVLIAGTGNGTVISAPAAIDCETPVTPFTNCVATFPPGASVTLTATAASGSTFTGWSGGGCSGTGVCTFTSTTDQTITATINSPNPPDFSLTASPLAPPAISAGQTATSKLGVSGANGFSGSVSLSCSIQPPTTLAPSCSINPGSVAAGGSAMLTVSTTPPGLAKNPSSSALRYALWLPMIGLVFAAAARGRKPGNRGLPKLILGGLLLFVVVSQVACGGGNPSHAGGTPKGNYTITVNGVSGTTQHSTSVVLNVE